MPSFRQRDPLTHSDHELLRIMEDDWNRSDSHYQDQFEDMKEDWKQFLLIKDSDRTTVSEQQSYDPEPGARANFKTGLMRKHLSTASSLIMRSLTLSEKNYAEWLVAKPRVAFAGENLQTVQNELEMYRQYRSLMLSAEHMDFYDKFEGFVTQGLVFYWSLMLLGWRREGRWVPRKQSEEDQMLADFEANAREDEDKPQKIKYDMDRDMVWNPRYIDRADVTILHTANTRPDPRGGMNLLDCAYLMDELRMSWYELKDKEYDEETGDGIYFNLDKLQEAVPFDDSTSTEEEQMRQDLGEQPADGVTTSDEDKEKESFRNTVILRRYWTHFGVVVADQTFKVIIAKRRYTKMPIYPFRYSIDWTKFDAQSFARLLRNVDENEDMLTNYRLDNLGTAIDGIVATNDGMISPDSRGKPRHAGSEIKFDGPVQGNIDILRTNDVTYGILEDRRFNETVATGLGGITENDAGQMFPGGRRLATEIQAVQAGSANRGGQLVERIEQSILTRIMNDMTLLEAARLGTDFQIETIEEKGEYAFPLITPKFVAVMANKIRFLANGSQFVNQREIEMAGILNFTNTFGQNPVAQQLINWPALLSIAAKRVAHLPDPDVILSDQAKSKTSIPPELEWPLMKLGYEPQPQLNDDDEQHMQMHQLQLQRAESELEEGKIDEAAVLKLQKHLAMTQQRIAQKQQASAAQAGPVATALPGERGSQETSGTQTANNQNPQPRGVRPPVREGVTG